MTARYADHVKGKGKASLDRGKHPAKMSEALGRQGANRLRIQNQMDSRESPKTITFGSHPDTSSSGLAISLAVVIGMYARRSVLLIDLGDQPSIPRDAFRVEGPSGIEPLLDHFIRTRSLDTDSISAQIAHVPQTESEGRRIAFLAGPAERTNRIIDRMAAQRGAEFVQALVKGCKSLGYGTIVVDAGPYIDSVRGEVLVGEADLVVVCQKAGASVHDWLLRRHRVPPHKESTRFVSVPETTFPFPDPRFLEPLLSSGDEGGMSASVMGLQLAGLLYPSIFSELVSQCGERIRPHRRWRKTQLEVVSLLLP